MSVKSCRSYRETRCLLCSQLRAEGLIGSHCLRRCRAESLLRDHVIHPFTGEETDMSNNSLEVTQQGNEMAKPDQNPGLQTSIPLFFPLQRNLKQKTGRHRSGMDKTSMICCRREDTGGAPSGSPFAAHALSLQGWQCWWPVAHSCPLLWTINCHPSAQRIDPSSPCRIHPVL